MNAKISRRFALKCPNIECSASTESVSTISGGPLTARVVRKGYFIRKSDSRRIARFQCLGCRRSFSRATFHPCVYQKKRTLNHEVRALLASVVSQRRIAKLLGISRTTVHRKLRHLAREAELKQAMRLQALKNSGRAFSELQFDELQTFEHSKCLPLSVPLVVDPKTRMILGFGVASMPANGPLTLVSIRKYGPRKDERAKEVSRLFRNLSPLVTPEAKWISDENPAYPFWIRKHFPKASHQTHKGRRGAVVGQGELKKIGFDPLFGLNHTCAMLRANVSRLVRRTWATTKRAERLREHLWVYMDYHNSELIGQA